MAFLNTDRAYSPEELTAIDEWSRAGERWDDIAHALDRPSGAAIRAKLARVARPVARPEPRPVAKSKYPRKHSCITCDAGYRQTHAGHRMCDPCRSGDAPEPDDCYHLDTYSLLPK